MPRTSAQSTPTLRLSRAVWPITLRRVLEIGLTGGIGSGKSTVAAALVGRGAVLIDADAVVRELQAPGQQVWAAIVERFGPEIVDADSGALDRPALARIVFSDAAALAALNAIVHPAVVDEMTARRQALAPTDRTVILDIPLLVESGYAQLGGMVVVDLDPDVAVARLVAARGFSEADARSRIAQQASRADRLARADFVVDNGGTPADLTREVERCWKWIEGLPRPVPSDKPVVPIRPRGHN